jgi:DNA-binding transcriptional ArsR family regulator
METTRINLENKTLVRTANLAKAIGHPVRIAILQFLAGRDVCICGDITDVIPLAQSTVSQHLKVLKEAGLIKGEVEGVKSCYCLNREGISELELLLNSFVSELNSPESGPCC